MTIKTLTFIKNLFFIFSTIYMLITLIIIASIVKFNCEHWIFSIIIWLLILCFILIPVFALGVYLKIGFFLRKVEEDTKFQLVLKNLVNPFFIGLIIALITAKITAPRIQFTIGISDFTPALGIDLSKVYTDSYSVFSQKLLGGYADIVEIKVEKIGKPYLNVMDALADDRIDMALLSPLNFIFYDKWESVKEDSTLKALKIVAYKFPNNGGHFYTTGFIFNRKNIKIRNIFEKIRDGNLDIDFPGNYRLILSDESLSTSTRAVPSIWLMTHNLNCALTKANYLPSDEMTQWVLDNPNYFGTCSSNNWDMMKINGKAEKFDYFPLDSIPIPYDPVAVNEEKWNENFDKGYQLLWDFITLRKLDISRNRQDIILDVLKNIMKVPIESNIQQEWLNNNKDFIDFLRSGVVESVNIEKSYISVFFPAYYNHFGDILWYENVEMNRYINIQTYKLQGRKETEKSSSWNDFSYPYKYFTFSITPPLSSFDFTFIHYYDLYLSEIKTVKIINMEFPQTGLIKLKLCTNIKNLKLIRGDHIKIQGISDSFITVPNSSRHFFDSGVRFRFPLK